jgi:16S rRNA (cytosine967-C5)-methyltransferase
VPFDAILIDAPCSATGIVRRQPDILLHRREADIDALVDTQATLLDAAWPLLAVRAGVLLYATCSILRAENAAQVDAFLARTPMPRTEPLDDAFGRDTGPATSACPAMTAWTASSMRG